MGLFIFVIGLFVGVGGLMLLLQIIQHIKLADNRDRTINNNDRPKGK